MRKTHAEPAIRDDPEMDAEQMATYGRSVSEHVHAGSSQSLRQARSNQRYQLPVPRYA